MRVTPSLLAGSASGLNRLSLGGVHMTSPILQVRCLYQVNRSRIHAVQFMQLCLQLTIIEDV